MRFLLTLIFVCFASFAAAQEPLIEVDLQSDETLPGQAVTLRVTVLVPTWMARPPEWPSYDSTGLFVRLPERSTSPTSRTIDGQTWSGISRRYLIAPMAPGSYDLPQSSVRVAYADPGGEDIILDLPVPAVNLIGLAPPGTENLSPFIAANSLTLEQSVEGSTESLAPGDSFSRTVSASVSGLAPFLLTALTPEHDIVGLRAYPATPEISETDDRGQLSGTRTETTTYIAEGAVDASLPPISVRWYNIQSGEIETAEIAGVQVSASGPSPAIIPSSQNLLELAGLLAILLLIGLVILRFVIRRRSSVPKLTERDVRKRLLRAISARRLGETRQALDLWLTLKPLNQPTKASITEHLFALGRAQHGPDGISKESSHWNALQSIIRRSTSPFRHSGLTRARAPALPPLNPPSA
ncbi:BatD family protein [Shimia haliotis]|uniref:Oxygen tolerance n=1 Tax=Shimia haliotis TaxID=1280847 RepID=A0A1I4HET3_9RHOB|nr:BatD family protein [Shimia haliotis]SFL40808.1 Oxygen tolerance [Shimia haliotis]